MKTLKFTLLAATVLMLCSSQVHAVGIDEHTVLLMCFDEGEGDVAVDLSPKENYGAIHGPTWTTDGKFGKAVEFDGSDDYIEVPDSESLNITDQMTIEAWIIPKNWGNWLRIAVKGNYPNFQYLMLLGGSLGQIGFCVKNSGAEKSAYTDAGAIELNKWNHVAGVCDGTQIMMYVNGELKTANPFALPIDTTNNVLTIGCTDNGAQRLEFFNGTIDELRISDIGRSQDEIQKMMNEGYTAPVESSGKLTTTWGSIKRK